MTDAIAAQRRGDLEAAEEGYRKAFSKGLRDPILLSNLATVLRRTQRNEEAEVLLRQAIQSTPRFTDAYINLGNLLRERGVLGEASECLNRALALQPQQVEALVNLGALRQAQNRNEEAREALERALQIQPQHVDALVHLASLQLVELHHEEAREGVQQALALVPNHLEGNATLARILEEQGLFEQALATWRRLVAIDPNFGPGLLGLALMLIHDEGEESLAEAGELINRVLMLRPTFSEAHNALSSLLVQQGDPEGAVAALQEALKADPENLRSQLMVRNNLGVLMLSAGNFSRIAWEHYESRWNAPGMHAFRYEHLRQWDGSKLQGNLLVSREQGIGDEIFYLGMIRELIAAGHRPVIELSPRLLSMVTPCFPDATIIAKNTPLDDLDIEAVISLGSVGLHCRNDEISFAFRRAPYVQGLPANGLLEELPLEQRSKLKVGLVWRSNSKKRGFRKSVSLRDLLPLTKLSSACFISLQHEALCEEEQEMLEQAGIYRPEADFFNDLETLSSWINLCDLVITVSTSTAHIACAMGARTWILLPYRQMQLWYWGTDGEESPWYPTARLLRQPHRGDWPGLIELVCKDLQVLAHRHAGIG